MTTPSASRAQAATSSTRKSNCIGIAHTRNPNAVEEASLTGEAALWRQSWVTRKVFVSKDQRYINSPILPVRKQTEMKAKELSAELADLWKKLNKYVSSPEFSTFCKRWTKKNKKQRVTILRAIRNDILAKHRADFDVFFRQESAQGSDLKAANLDKKTLEIRRMYRAHAINLEDLVDDEASEPLLITFMKSRGNEFPVVFAHQDFEFQRLGILNDAIQKTEIHHTMFKYCIALSHGVPDETYARLVPRTAFNTIEEKDRPQPNTVWSVQATFLLLGTQIDYYSFLVDCFDHIMKVSPGQDSKLPKGQDKKGKGKNKALAKSAGDSGSSSQAVISSQAPKEEGDEETDSHPTLLSTLAYGVPRATNLLHIQRLAEAKRDEVGDMIRRLEEDPSFLNAAVADYIAYDARSLDRNLTAVIGDGSLDPERLAKVLKRRDRLLDIAITTVMFEAVEEWCLWRAMAWSLEKAESCLNKYGKNWQNGKYDHEMPDELVWAVLPFKLVKNIRASLSVRFNAKSPVPDLDLFADAGSGQPKRKFQEKTRISHLLSMLSSEEDLLKIGLCHIVDYVDNRMSDMMARGDKTFTAWHKQQVFNLGILAEIDLQLRLYDDSQIGGRLGIIFAHARGMDPELKTQEAKYYDSLPDATRPPTLNDEPDAQKYRPLVLDMVGFDDARIEAKEWAKANQKRHEAAKKTKSNAEGDQLVLQVEQLRFFKGPIQYYTHCRTQEQVDANLRAEYHTLKAWTSFRDHWAKQSATGNSPLDSAGNLWRRMGLTHTIVGTRPLSPQSTPTLSNILASTSQRHHAYDVPDFNPIPGTGSSFDLPRRFVPTEMKKKDKTVGTSMPFPEEEGQHVPELEPPEENETIHLKDPYLMTMHQIFDLRLGQPKWMDFVKAMEKSSFVVRKLQGSGWHFSPDDDLKENHPAVYKDALIFHEPHPDKTIRPDVASALASRLRKHYGWEKDTFQPPGMALLAEMEEAEAEEDNEEE